MVGVLVRARPAPDRGAVGRPGRHRRRAGRHGAGAVPGAVHPRRDRLPAGPGRPGTGRGVRRLLGHRLGDRQRRHDDRGRGRAVPLLLRRSVGVNAPTTADPAARRRPRRAGDHGPADRSGLPVVARAGRGHPRLRRPDPPARLLPRPGPRRRHPARTLRDRSGPVRQPPRSRVPGLLGPLLRRRVPPAARRPRRRRRQGRPRHRGRAPAGVRHPDRTVVRAGAHPRRHPARARPPLRLRGAPPRRRPPHRHCPRPRQLRLRRRGAVAGPRRDAVGPVRHPPAPRPGRRPRCRCARLAASTGGCRSPRSPSTSAAGWCTSTPSSASTAPTDPPTHPRPGWTTRPCATPSTPPPGTRCCGTVAPDR